MLDKFFSHPGYRIKSAAKAVFVCNVVLLSIAMVIAFFVCLSEAPFAIIGLPFAAAAELASVYLVSLAVYSYGELVDSTEENASANALIADYVESLAKRDTETRSASAPTANRNVHDNREISQPIPTNPTEKRSVLWDETAVEKILTHALRYSADSGLRRFLNRQIDSFVPREEKDLYKQFLDLPDGEIRTAIEQWLNNRNNMPR